MVHQRYTNKHLVRPIISCSGSQRFNLSKHSANILKPYTLLNKQLQELVPTGDALLIIKKFLENDETPSDRTSLSPKNTLDILEFLIRTTFFIFSGTYYQQTEGVATTFINSCRIYVQATTALTTTIHPSYRKE